MLLIFLNTRGFGYALFEDVLVPVDWGIKTAQTRGVHDCLEKVRVLMHLLQPTIIVLQDCEGKLSRCTKRIEKLVDRTSALARTSGIKIFRYSRADVRQCFAPYGARSKDEIARAIAKLLPEFAPRVPPMRKLWMSEDYPMSLFDALALMFTYYANELLRPA